MLMLLLLLLLLLVPRALLFLVKSLPMTLARLVMAVVRIPVTQCGSLCLSATEKPVPTAASPLVRPSSSLIHWHPLHVASTAVTVGIAAATTAARTVFRGPPPSAFAPKRLLLLLLLPPTRSIVACRHWPSPSLLQWRVGAQGMYLCQRLLLEVS